MSKLSLFLCLLKDDSWYSINELSTALNVPQDRFDEMVKLLHEHNVIEYKQDTHQVKIDPKWRFLCEEFGEFEEQNQAVGTIIIPQGRSVKLQGMTVTNLTDIALELDVRIDKEIKEIAVNKIA